MSGNMRVCVYAGVCVCVCVKSLPWSASWCTHSVCPGVAHGASVGGHIYLAQNPDIDMRAAYRLTVRKPYHHHPPATADCIVKKLLKD